MNKFITISLILVALILSGCVTPDPFYSPRGNTYGAAKTVDIGETEEGAGTTNSAFRLAERVPQEESIQVSWDLTLHPTRGRARAPERDNCEVLVKPTGSLTYVPYRCERVEKVGRDFMVYYWYKETVVAINLQTMPGDFVQNRFCESGVWSPTQRLTARVVWQTHETVRPSHGLARAIGCKPI